MVATETELEIDELTKKFMELTDNLLSTHNYSLESPMQNLLYRADRPSEFSKIAEKIDDQWPSNDQWPSGKFNRHEWEMAVDLFQRLFEYWDIVAASVLIPLAKDIALDEMKNAYEAARQVGLHRFDKQFRLFEI